MTQNKNELLTTDLSARLPYGVKISIPDLWTDEKYVEVLNEIFKGDDGKYRVNDSGLLVEYVKPYLFPMSSMTEEQRKYISDRWGEHLVTLSDILGYVKWLIENHFDVNGLIPMGLAIDTTNLNIY